MTEHIFYLHQHINDFDEFCSNARHWDIEYHQFEAGKLSSKLMMFSDANTLFTRAQLHRGMIQRGMSPQGLVTIGILATPNTNIHWRNIGISGDT